MTIRHMLIFRSVCENGYNSTKAAEALHMTQPAVSLAIKELEQYYGVHLFDRIGRRLQITDAGQHFLQYAIHISDLFSDMEISAETQPLYFDSTNQALSQSRKNHSMR